MLVVDRRVGMALHFGFWGGLTLLFLAFLSANFPFGEALALSVGNFATLALLFYAHVRLVDRFFEQRRFAGFFLRSLLCFAAVCTARFLLHAWILKKYLVNTGVLLVSPEGRLGIFVLVTSFMFAVFAVIFRLLQNRYRREVHNLNLLAEKQAAELQLLKAQINPHFLFNALNNLYSLVVAQSEQAAPMLVKLSHLLRYVIYESQKPKAELHREIAEIRNFMELYAMQFSQAPDLQFVVKGPAEDLFVEPMLLIPLLENCFKHGDLGKKPAAFCHLELEVAEGQQLHFGIRNSYDAADRQKDQVGGVGLGNMRRRLALRYAGQHHLELRQNEGVFEVKLHIDLAHAGPINH
jgi:sensor histidine kinase YesM